MQNSWYKIEDEDYLDLFGDVQENVCLYLRCFGDMCVNLSEHLLS